MKHGVQPAEVDSVVPAPSWIRDGIFGDFGRYVYRLGTPGFGSCFFDSVCAAMNYRGYLSKSIREKAAIVSEYRCSFASKLVQSKWDDFRARREVSSSFPANVDDMKRQLCNPKIWAKEAMILFVSDELGINIIFLDDKNERMHCGIHGSSPLTQPTIFILWIQNSHFEPIALCLSQNPGNKTNHAHTLKMVFEPSNPNDTLFLNKVLDAYRKSCPCTRSASRNGLCSASSSNSAGGSKKKKSRKRKSRSRSRSRTRLRRRKSPSRRKRKRTSR